VSPDGARTTNYPVVIEVAVRWGDLNARVHVDNSVYYQYFQMARVAYLDRIGMPAPGPAWRDFGWVIGSTCCRYLASVTYPDMLIVGARVGALSDDRALMEYGVTSAKLDRVAAEGEALLVAYDFGAGRVRHITDEIRTAITLLERRELPRVPRGVGRMPKDWSEEEEGNADGR
jgi:acyl-CoA thioester hydrolase